MSQGTADNITFILVRPLFLGNIGSIARAMKNFGLVNIRLVNPPKNYKDAEARKMSVGAFDLLKKAQVFSSLEEAIADQGLVIGTSSGQQRAMPLETVANVSKKLLQASSHSRVAIVFGDEINGLPNAELAMCHQLVRIPTDPSFASMNLAQAVGIFAYELSRPISSLPIEEKVSRADSPDIQLSTVAEANGIFDLMGKLVEVVEFSRSFNKQLVLQEIRRFYYRASPTRRESDLLKGVLHCLLQKLEAPAGDPPGD